MRKELITYQDPKSPISEIFKTLRTNIQFMNAKGSLKTILVTSSMSGEGKSWVSSNLAVAFAQAGKKVILVDADMRKGRQYSIFGISPKPGLSNYLSGVEANGDTAKSDDLLKYLQRTEIDNLCVISAGNIPPNPSELLMTTRMIQLLEDLKQLCDIVIIDGTPSRLVTDAIIISRLVDSTIVVTKSGETNKNDLKTVIDNINNVGGKILGVVVNQIPMSAKKYGEKYYYASTSLDTPRPNKTTANVYKPSQDNRKDEASVRINNSENNIAKETPNIKIENSDQISIEKTNDILKQINEYLDKEKKKL